MSATVEVRLSDLAWLVLGVFMFGNVAEWARRVALYGANPSLPNILIWVVPPSAVLLFAVVRIMRGQAVVKQEADR